MNGASSPALVGANPASGQVSTLRLVAWTVLFQIAWYWKKIPALIREGEMSDTDDFQRLAQVRDWLTGQGWYDLVNHRMNPPDGADIHWSRLVDVPIAALIRFFDLFLEPVLADRLATLVWPIILLVATVLVLQEITRRLEPSANPLLTLLFTVTCLTALTEFMPGRIDHHGVQILLFTIMLLGLTMPREGRGPVLFGLAAAASISVGLDAIMIVVFLFAWLGAGWVFGRDPRGRGLLGAAIGIGLSAPVLYVLNYPPQTWLEARCDANSAFYLLGLLLVSLSYGLLYLVSPRLMVAGNAARTAWIRLAIGAMTGGLALLVLLSVYPRCAAGPFADLPQALQTRWLVHVFEAKGLLEQWKSIPQLGFWGVLYPALMLAVAGAIVLRRFRAQPEILALMAVLVISIAASFFQYRAMRIGIFASIPFCVIAVGMAARRIDGLSLSGAAKGALKAMTVIALLSPTWLAVGMLVLPAKTAKPVKQSASIASQPDWRSRQPAKFCNRQSEFAGLAGLVPGLAMTDVDTGPGALVFTRHSVVGGPYHRNAKAILDIIDFFDTDEATARRIAVERRIDYVAFCESPDPLDESRRNSPGLAVKMRLGTEPEWLERVSAPGARMHVFRVRRD